MHWPYSIRSVSIVGFIADQPDDLATTLIEFLRD